MKITEELIKAAQVFRANLHYDYDYEEFEVDHDSTMNLINIIDAYNADWAEPEKEGKDGK